MHFYDRRNVLLLRVLTPLLGSAITPDVTCVVGLELVRVAVLQAYLANAGVLTPRSLWCYCVSSPSLGRVCVVLLTIQSRGVSARTPIRHAKICAGGAPQQQKAIDTS